jgi:hypothetical protein
MNELRSIPIAVPDTGAVFGKVVFPRIGPQMMVKVLLFALSDPPHPVDTAPVIRPTVNTGVAIGSVACPITLVSLFEGKAIGIAIDQILRVTLQFVSSTEVKVDEVFLIASDSAGHVRTPLRYLNPQSGTRTFCSVVSYFTYFSEQCEKTPKALKHAVELKRKASVALLN